MIKGSKEIYFYNKYNTTQHSTTNMADLSLPDLSEYKKTGVIEYISRAIQSGKFTSFGDKAENTVIEFCRDLLSYVNYEIKPIHYNNQSTDQNSISSFFAETDNNTYNIPFSSNSIECPYTTCVNFKTCTKCVKIAKHKAYMKQTSEPVSITIMNEACSDCAYCKERRACLVKKDKLAARYDDRLIEAGLDPTKVNYNDKILTTDRFYFITLAASPDAGDNKHLTKELTNRFLTFMPTCFPARAHAYSIETTNNGVVHLHGLIRFVNLVGKQNATPGQTTFKRLYISNQLRSKEKVPINNGGEGKCIYLLTDKKLNTSSAVVREKYAYISKEQPVPIGSSLEDFLKPDEAYLTVLKHQKDNNTFVPEVIPIPPKLPSPIPPPPKVTVPSPKAVTPPKLPSPKVELPKMFIPAKVPAKAPIKHLPPPPKTIYIDVKPNFNHKVMMSERGTPLPVPTL